MKACLLTELVEVHQFGDSGLLVNIVPHLEPVGQNTVVVDLAFDVVMLEETEAQLIVIRQELVALISLDADPDVGDLGIVMHEHEMVVEDTDVQRHHEELDNECEEVADETLAALLQIMVVQLEHVAVSPAAGKVTDGHKHEVEDSEESVPDHTLTHEFREALNEAIGQHIDEHKESEQDGVCGGSKCEHQHLLPHVVVAILEVGCDRQELKLLDWAVHELEAEPLTQVVKEHGHSKTYGSKDKSAHPVDAMVLLGYAHVREHLSEQEA